MLTRLVMMIFLILTYYEIQEIKMDGKDWIEICTRHNQEIGKEYFEVENQDETKTEY